MICGASNNLRPASLLLVLAVTLGACTPYGEMIELTFRESVMRADVAAQLISSGFTEIDADAVPAAALVNQQEGEVPRAIRIFRHSIDAHVRCFFMTGAPQGEWSLTCADDERFSLPRKNKLPPNPERKALLRSTADAFQERFGNGVTHVTDRTD